MALALPREESSRVALAMYKPIAGYDIHDALSHISTAIIPALHNAGSTKAAVLNSVNGSWVAIFSVWKDALSEKEDCRIAGELGKDWESSIVRVVEWRWFQLSCEEHRDVSFSQLRYGDIVSLRRIGSSRKKQEVLAYSCLAIMKAYFKQMKGIRSYTFYRSLDGKRIMGLGIWDNIDSASALLKEPNGNFAESYWYGLGAKRLKYEVCQVVFVSTAPQLDKQIDVHKEQVGDMVSDEVGKKCNKMTIFPQSRDRYSVSPTEGETFQHGHRFSSATRSEKLKVGQIDWKR